MHGEEWWIPICNNRKYEIMLPTKIGCELWSEDATLVFTKQMQCILQLIYFSGADCVDVNDHSYLLSNIIKIKLFRSFCKFCSSICQLCKRFLTNAWNQCASASTIITCYDWSWASAPLATCLTQCKRWDRASVNILT
jgi:hypothetical protein